MVKSGTVRIKTFDDSYLYHKSEYQQSIAKFLMTSEFIDKNSEAFSDIAYGVKMKGAPILYKVLMSSKVRLCVNSTPNPRPFKVVYAIDVKNRNRGIKLAYIDCSEIIKNNGGTYTCKSIPTLVSYLMEAMTYIIYNDENNGWNNIVNNIELTRVGSEAFSDLMMYVLGYLKMPITYGDNKEQLIYMTALYYQRSILCKTDENIYALSEKISKISKQRATYLRTIFDVFYGDKDYVTIDVFLDKIIEIITNTPAEDLKKDKNKLDLSSFIDRWMYAFGPRTMFGAELFVPFATMINDCYVGAYINNQNTIEKVVGKNVPRFTNTLLDIGGGLA